jgi:hypothetical protein
MTTTFTWSINGLMVKNEDGLDEVAVMSNFTINGVDENGKTGSVSYSVNLLPPDAQQFTPYADITEEQAIQWTQGALDATGPNEEGLTRTQAMEAEVQQQIDAQYIPEPQPAPLPWATPAEATE